MASAPLTFVSVAGALSEGSGTAGLLAAFTSGFCRGDSPVGLGESPVARLAPSAIGSSLSASFTSPPAASRFSESALLFFRRFSRRRSRRSPRLRRRERFPPFERSLLRLSRRPALRPSLSRLWSRLRSSLRRRSSGDRDRERMERDRDCDRDLSRERRRLRSMSRDRERDLERERDLDLSLSFEREREGRLLLLRSRLSLRRLRLRECSSLERRWPLSSSRRSGDLLLRSGCAFLSKMNSQVRKFCLHLHRIQLKSIVN